MSVFSIALHMFDIGHILTMSCIHMYIGNHPTRPQNSVKYFHIRKGG